MSPSSDSTTATPNIKQVTSTNYEQIGLISHPSSKMLRLSLGDGRLLSFIFEKSRDCRVVRDLVRGRCGILKLVWEEIRGEVVGGDRVRVASSPFGAGVGGVAGKNTISTVNKSIRTVKSSRYEIRAKITTDKKVSGYLTTCFGQAASSFGQKKPRWTRRYFRFLFDEKIGKPVIRGYKNESAKECEVEIDLSSGAVLVGGNGGLRVDASDFSGGIELPNPHAEEDVYAFGVSTATGYYVFVSSSDEVVANFADTLTNVLSDDLRDYLLASDSTSLSSYLCSVLKRDNKVGLLKNAEVRVSVNVWEDGGDVNVVVGSEGVKNSAEEKNADGDGDSDILSRRTQKTIVPSNSNNNSNKLPRPPNEDNDSIASSTSNPAPPTVPPSAKRKTSVKAPKRSSALATRGEKRRISSTPRPPPSPDRDKRENSIEKKSLPNISENDSSDTLQAAADLEKQYEKARAEISELKGEAEEIGSTRVRSDGVARDAVIQPPSNLDEVPSSTATLPKADNTPLPPLEPYTMAEAKSGYLKIDKTPAGKMFFKVDESVLPPTFSCYKSEGDEVVIETIELTPDTIVKYAQNRNEADPTMKEMITLSSPSIGTRMFFAENEDEVEEWLDSLEDSVVKGKMEEEKRKRMIV